MEWCWQQVPSARPSMSQVQAELQSLHALLTSPSTLLSAVSQAAPLAGAGSFASLHLLLAASAPKAGSLSPSTTQEAAPKADSSFGAGSGFVPLDAAQNVKSGAALSSSALKPLASSATLGLPPATIPKHSPGSSSDAKIT